jgi:hypothetical protein
MNILLTRAHVFFRQSDKHSAHACAFLFFRHSDEHFAHTCAISVFLFVDAYGALGKEGVVPPNSVLDIDLELVSWKRVSE